MRLPRPFDDPDPVPHGPPPPYLALARGGELERRAAEMDGRASGERRSNDGRRLDPLGAMEVAPSASDGVP